ncbi:ABC-F family ATP-binding cassette domain-containing protein [Psychroflexus maritimus]|uniref:ABC-F family ATP-binding cassette domain-containing protein n=1 Tax=Psychroflexus maritimus TaxID=2714865 RepID=A0A967ABT6_9FLAO|nr:ABC-F family ATP-binding cassette domain-containing protein [Psychroflexus maritimus]NGZ88750.1 ABC-F family ATP-binding cassette domain-containing protein [Psychroflexus maritimus]
MNYVSVENISKSYGILTLFEGISFGINQGQKIGFVAKNGSGKTTLLKILSGKETPDEGQVNYRKELKVGILHQEPDLDPNLSIEEAIFASDNQILRAISKYEKALQNLDDTETYQAAFDQMDQLQAWDFETQYRQILFKLKLDDLSKKVADLSGGQEKRLALAILLLQQPDLLILDEPTNHLDLEMIEWLESFFASENMSLFMVTHDRYFLERVCNSIIELDEGELYTYKGNYSYYLEKREQRLETEAATVSKAKQLYKKELDWMRRQPKARTTKSKSRISDFGDVKERAHKRRKDHQVELEINMQRLGTKVVEMHKISKSFEGKDLFTDFDYNIKKGDRIGIIGKNGSGKSTFLKILTGKLQPDTGKVVIGETVQFGYYTQGGIQVKQGQKVIDVVREFGEYIPLQKGRKISAQQLLERFLFDRKKQYDFVEKLSGGERKRLYLCTVLIQNPNFLILDEPTNDLDIITLNVLENFLLDYPGCLLVVSHDRYFMDKIVDHLFVFGDHRIKDFPGNYSDYREIEERLKNSDDKEEKPQETKSVSANTKTDKTKSLSYNEQKAFKKLEKEIQDLEKKKKQLEHKFLEELSPEEIKGNSINLEEITQSIEAKSDEWLELSMKMEE